MEQVFLEKERKKALKIQDKANAERNVMALQT